MIPDDPAHFKTFLFSVPKNFDDAEARFSYQLGQDTVWTAEGRHLLYCCPLCKRLWYKAGKSEYSRLTNEQLAHLGEVLHVDIRLLYAFPQALCRICSVIYLGGTFSVEEYRPDIVPYRWGYRFTWEDATSSQAHLLGMVCRREQLSTRELVRMLLGMQPDMLTTPVRHARAVLTWMENLSFPEVIARYGEEESQQLGQRIPPRPGPDGLARTWCGYSWIQECSPLHGEVLVSLASALDPQATPSFTGLFTSWKVLAQMMRMIL